MALGHTPTNAQLCRRFQWGLQILLDTFYDSMLLYTQDIQVVNFSDISTGFVNVIIMYKDVEGRSVKLEAMGNIDKDYVQTLDFLWQAMKRAAQEAPSDYSGPFLSLTLPTHNDLLKILTGTIKKITNKPISGCRRLFFQDAQAQPTHYVSMYYTMTKDYRGYARSPCSRNPPSADDKKS